MMGRRWLEVDDGSTRGQRLQQQCQMVDTSSNVEGSSSALESVEDSNEGHRTGDRIGLESGTNSTTRVDQSRCLQQCESKQTRQQKRRLRYGYRLIKFSQLKTKPNQNGEENFFTQQSRLEVSKNVGENTNARDNYDDNGRNLCAAVSCVCERKQPPSGGIKSDDLVGVSTNDHSVEHALEDENETQLDSGQRELVACCCVHLASCDREPVVRCRSANDEIETGSTRSRRRLSKEENEKVNLGKQAAIELSWCESNETNVLERFARLTGNLIGQNLFSEAPKLRTKTTSLVSGTISTGACTSSDCMSKENKTNDEDYYDEDYDDDEDDNEKRGKASRASDTCDEPKNSGSCYKDLNKRRRYKELLKSSLAFRNNDYDSVYGCKLIGGCKQCVKRLVVSSSRCMHCLATDRKSLSQDTSPYETNSCINKRVETKSDYISPIETTTGNAIYNSQQDLDFKQKKEEEAENCIGKKIKSLKTSSSMNEVKRSFKCDILIESESVSLTAARNSNQLDLAPIEPRREFVSSAQIRVYNPNSLKSSTLHQVDKNEVIRASDLEVNARKKVMVQSTSDAEMTTTGAQEVSSKPSVFISPSPSLMSSNFTSITRTKQIESTSITNIDAINNYQLVSIPTAKRVDMDPKTKFKSRLHEEEQEHQPRKFLIEQQWSTRIKSHKSAAFLDSSNIKYGCCKIKYKHGCPCKQPSPSGEIDIKKDDPCTNLQPVPLDSTSRSDEDERSSKNVAFSAFANTNRKVLSKHGTGGAGNSNRPLKERENWSKNIEFLLAVIGFAVDLGNVWRFPYICYKNGGGAFLIPYTIMFIFGGLPIFYLEMSLGQYFSSGCLTVWRRVCPMAKGIGYAMCVLNFFTGLYYNTIISWAVFFFVESFATTLPWTSCTNSWNKPTCRTIEQRQDFRRNATTSDDIINSTIEQHYTSPTSDYFEREVLQINKSSGIDDLGSIRKPLAIYLAIVFVCIYLAIWKGVKSTGKAVWITALLPYFVLIPLLVRGLFLEGAWIGIKYYLYPDWAKIIDVDVWVEAAKQIYFSLGPGFGTLMALSSYNKFHHNCRKDAIIAAAVNYFASFISGLVIFAVLGYMATMQSVEIINVATEGPGLVFIVYPEGLATMQFSAVWSILFFMMVITLGIDSTFGGLESVITGLCDEYPRILRAHRGIFIGLLIIMIYLCSIPTTTYGGNHVIYLLESYGTSLSLLFIVSLETIIVCWIYGADKFCENLEEMYGERPSVCWRICWKYISPTILVLIFFAACTEELGKYQSLKNGNYIYPGWAPSAGLLMTGSSVCCVPIYAIYYLKTRTSGSFIERLRTAIKPLPADSDEEDERSCYYDDDGITNKIKEDNDAQLDTVI